MRVLIAVDSFKDALTAGEACRAIGRGLAGKPGIAAQEFPLSDGGEGALEVVAGHLKLRPVHLAVRDPIGREIQAMYGRSADGALAFIELARASGLQLLKPHERNAMTTSTFGVGQMIADAARRGARRIVVAIGGSATVDAGVGAAAALGWRFLDTAGHPVWPGGGALAGIAQIERAGPLAAGIEVLCDVTNPLFGPKGAAVVYGPQKGADEKAVRILDAGLAHLSELAERELGLRDLAQMPGAGAAGGFGFGALAFFGAALRKGADCIMDLCGFDEALQAADVVITGEGRLDGQTAQGKLISVLCARAAKQGRPVVALCGQVDASAADIAAIGLAQAVPINPAPAPLATMLARTAENLERAAADLHLDALVRRRS